MPLRRAAVVLTLAATVLWVLWVPPPVSARPGPEARGAAVAPRAVRPNIVVIMTDDMAATDLRWMPRTRRLIGGNGVRFDNAVSTNPLCCPARATLLTGQESHNNRVWTNGGPHGGFDELTRRSRLPQWLQRAGYRTAMIGKHLNGYSPALDGREPGWDWFDPTTSGIYRYTDFSSYHNGRPVTVRDGYITDYVARESVGVIRRFEQRDRAPFFLWASYVAPHRAEPARCPPRQLCWRYAIPAARHRSLYPTARPPSLDKPSYNEDDMSDKDAALQLLRKVDRRMVVRDYRTRIRTLAAVDQAVARTLGALKRTGELDRTLVVFTSDNGYALGEHRWIGKVLPFEESLRVPLLVRGPGVSRGRVGDQLATTADLTATIVSAARARPGRRLDGRSLRRYLRNPAAADARPGMLIESGGFGFFWPQRDWTYRGYREGRYTLARYHDGGWELYDRAVDPHEVASVAGDPAYAEVRAELLRRYRAVRDCAGAGCRPSFGSLPEPAPTARPRVTTVPGPPPTWPRWSAPYLR